MDLWKVLLEKAIRHIKSSTLSSDQWTFGGGTVLMLRYNHRQSKDIDIFFNNPQMLPYVSPRVNDALDGEFGDYEESTSLIRLTFELDNSIAKIDFIAAPKVTNTNPSKLKFNDGTVYLDSSTEIVAKKIFYRCETFSARDVYDLATVVMAEGSPELAEFCLKHKNKFEALKDRVDAMISDNVLITEIKKLDTLQKGIEPNMAISTVSKFICMVQNKIES